MTHPVPLAGPERIPDLIPQRPPFVLVDTLVSATEAAFTSSFIVPDEHVLVQDGALTVPGLMEHVAQTAAMGIGFHAHATGARPPIGFIGSIDRLTVERRPGCGERLETTVLLRNQVMNVHLLHGTVRLGEMAICTMELKVFLMDGTDAA